MQHLNEVGNPQSVQSRVLPDGQVHLSAVQPTGGGARSGAEYQSQLNPEPVGVIVGDIDRFKSVNDTHGHATGDAVLSELAYIIRSQLRAFDPAYRIGGEEFVTLLLGERAGDALALAERIRAAVCAQPIAGLPITISFGVAASGDGEPFRWNDAFQSADRALYEAKRTGRNRVCGAGHPPGGSAERDRRRSPEQRQPQATTAGPRPRSLARRPTAAEPGKRPAETRDGSMLPN